MSDEELKALLADVAKQQQESARQQQEFASLRSELDKQWAAEHAKTEAAQRLTEETLRQATDRMAKEHAKTEAAQKRTEETLRQVTKQLGGLGNKFGSFTEGLAYDSMRRILKRHFGAEVVSSRTKAFRGELTQEYDMLAIRNGAQGEVYVAEVKSELNAQELDKTLKKLRTFFDFVPHLKGMKLYGIVCAVDVRGATAEMVLREGLYLATAGDENFKLVKPPPNFKPRAFTAK